MNTKASPLAEYALPPGIPALQADPHRLHRGFALCALALTLLAVSIGYLLGRSQFAGPLVDVVTMQR